MNVLEKAQGHYKSICSKERLEIHIPEWDSTVYVRPEFNLQSQGEIAELANNDKLAEAMVMTLILRLVDGEGKPVFKKIEKTELLRTVDASVITRIVGEINKFDPTEEDISGN